MTLQTILALSLATSLSVTFAAKAHADDQAAIDGCIDQLRTVGGPDAQAGGEILSSSWSQAGTLVQLRDAGGTTWECIGYDDGTVGDLRVADAADDGGGAMAGASAAQSGPVVVHFQTGTTGATYDGDLGPGEALQYILGARNGQVLTVRISPPNGDIYYQIINPDDSRLLDMVPAGTPYEGQLWQSGDHVVEMVNQTDETIAYRIELAIK